MHSAITAIISMLLPLCPCANRQPLTSVSISSALERLPIIKVPSLIEFNQAIQDGNASRDTAEYVALRQRSHNNELTDNEWATLIKQCTTATGTTISPDWIARYKPFVQDAYDLHRLTADQISDLMNRFLLRIESRGSWPVATKPVVRLELVGALDACPWSIARVTPIPEKEGMQDAISTHDNVESLIWNDRAVMAEWSGPDLVSLNVTVQSSSDERHNVNFVESVNMHPLKSANEMITSITNQKIQEWLEHASISVDCDIDGSVYVSWSFNQLADLVSIDTNAVLAIELQLLNGDRTIASGVAWWSARLDKDALPEAMYRLIPNGVQVPMKLAAGERIKPGDMLVLRIDSSETVALRSIEKSRMYDVHANLNLRVGLR